MNNKTDLIDSIPILNLTAEQYFNTFLDSKLIDLIYLYAMGSISSIGCILCLVCVWIFFRRKEFDQPFFLFYKILSINSFLHGFFGTWYSLCNSNWYLSFKLQTLCVNYVIAYIPFHIFFHNHAILVEIGILIEMLKLFNQTIKRNIKLDPKKMLVILFLISVLIGALGSFLKSANELVWLNYETSNNMTIIRKETIMFVGPNDFAKSKTGAIYFITYSLAVHVPLISIQFIANLTLIVVMKKHFSKLSLQNQTRSSQNKKKERLNKRTSLMALILCSLSLISRTTLLIGLVSINIRPFDFFSNFTLALSELIIFFNVGILFFVCFSFNKIFRNHVLELIRIRKISSETSTSTSSNQK